MWLAEQAAKLLGGEDTVLVVDDVALPKKGTASVGVAGKRRVSLTLARGEVPLSCGCSWVWIDNPARCAKPGVAGMAARITQTKPEIALAEIDRLIATGLLLRAACWQMPLE